MPGPKDMLALAGDSELRTLATRCVEQGRCTVKYR